MKINGFYFYISILVILLTACNKDKTEISETTDFPLLFKYQGPDIMPSKYFEFSNGSFQEINITNGILLEANDYLVDEVLSEKEEPLFNIDEIEILSDTTTRILIVSYDDPDDPSFNIDTILPSIIQDDALTIDFGFMNLFSLDVADDYRALEYCILSYTATYFDNFRGRRELSPLNLEYCLSRDHQIQLSDLLQNDTWLNNNIMEGDTLLLNISPLRFELE